MGEWANGRVGAGGWRTLDFEDEDEDEDDFESEAVPLAIGYWSCAQR